MSGAAEAAVDEPQRLCIQAATTAGLEAVDVLADDLRPGARISLGGLWGSFWEPGGSFLEPWGSFFGPRVQNLDFHENL